MKYLENVKIMKISFEAKTSLKSGLQIMKEHMSREKEVLINIINICCHVTITKRLTRSKAKLEFMKKFEAFKLDHIFYNIPLSDQKWHDEVSR